MEKNNLIDHWLAQENSPEDREEMERIIRFTENLDAPSLTTKESAWDSLMSKIDESTEDNERLLVPEKKKSNSWMVWTASIAAALFIGYFTIFNNTGTGGLITYSTNSAETISQILPDQSQVMLNAASSIEFNEKNWSSERMIALTGEAFFEVTEGEKFSVQTNAGVITVLGTSFNVYNRNNDFSVQCFTGTVQVEANNETVVLTAHQTATIHSQTGRLTISEFNPQKTATWRIGEFYFDTIELSTVVEELERQFNIQIEVRGDISDRFYSGFFSTQNLTEALQLVFVPMGLSTSVNGDTVTVE